MNQSENQSGDQRPSDLRAKLDYLHYCYLSYLGLEGSQKEVFRLRCVDLLEELVTYEIVGKEDLIRLYKRMQQPPNQ